MKKTISIIAVVCALGGTAFAQDEDTTGSSETTEVAPAETAPATAPVTVDSSSSAGYKMGIGATLNGAANNPELHFLYQLGSAYLDSSLGFKLTNTSPDVGDSVTTWSLSFAEGYRMYKAVSNRIHPYLEPYGRFSVSDNNDTAGTALAFGVGAQFGAEFALFDQFTLGTSLGAEIGYGVSDTANVLTASVYTTQIDATFWW